MATTDVGILTAAKRLLAARGYDGTSVRVICRQAVKMSGVRVRFHDNFVRSAFF